MRKIIYFDTSALAKWYVRETGSDDVEKYIQEQSPVDVSDLTLVEMRALLARRRREATIDSRMETRIYATFEEDIRQGFLFWHPLPTGLAASAINLLSILSDLPLRSLDALHLALAKEIQAGILATADKVMAAGAHALGFSVVRFDRKSLR